MNKHTILFVAANPEGTDLGALTQTARSLEKELELSGHRDRFELKTRWAARPLDLLHELRKLRPTVVHFSGGPAARDDRAVDPVDPDGGLYFQGPDGRAQRVSAAALAETFGAVMPRVQMVVLSPCYNDLQAEALVAHVGTVVGMVGGVLDDAVHSFAIGLYGGLCAGESVADAYRQGCAAISLQCKVGGDRARIRVRAGVDPSRLILAAEPPQGLPARVDLAAVDAIREVISRSGAAGEADDDASAQLDAYTELAVASSYFEAVGPSIDRIEPARVGGEGKVKTVDLENLYISLIADPTTFEEHERARELEATMFIARSGEGRWTDLIGRPLPSGVIRRIQNNELPGDRKTSAAPPAGPADPANPDDKAEQAAASAEGESLHGVVRQHRHCVILGDPGSGKSVLCRWLFRESAKCWRSKRASPELGPARVPFLILLRDFAQWLVARPEGSVLEYLCSTNPAGSAGVAGDWPRFVRQIVKRGKAFVILDGLDEVPRKAMLGIREMIEAFTRQRVTASAEPGVRPDAGIGNQIVITSRCTGYYQTALSSEVFAHFVIRPMTARQIDQFCRHWCRAIDRAALAEPLLAEIFDPRRPNIRSMASNPLLLSILCQLSSKEAKRVVQLPQIRAELYEKVVRETAEHWRRGAHASLSAAEPYFARLLVGVDNVLALFAPVAGHMHAHLISNEIDETQLQQRLVKALAWFDGRAEHELEEHEWNERKTFLMAALERVVGVLSERSPGRYSFLHLTFQEYLAGISLLLAAAEDRAPGAPVFEGSAQILVDRILDNEYLLDPRWRQPLLLLCGQLAWMERCSAHGQDRRAPRLAEVIALLDLAHRDGRTKLRDDWWAIILADILAEVPDEMLRDGGSNHAVLVRTVAQLLDAYRQLGAGDDRARGRLIFTEKLAIIRRRIGGAAFEDVVFGVCRDDRAPERSACAAHLLLSRAWLGQRVVEFFLERADHDCAPWQWPIHRLLRQAATVEPLINVIEPVASLTIPAPEAVRELRHYRAALPEWQRAGLELSERTRLSAPLVAAATASITAVVSEAALAAALGDPEDGLLAVAILGGFGDHDARRRRERYRELARWAESSDGEREASLDAEPWRYVPWFGAEDPDYSVAVHLDTSSKRLYLPADPVRMTAARIVRHGALAIASAHAIAARSSIAAMLAARSGELPADWDLGELIAVCRLVGLDDLLARVRTPGRREAQRAAWHLERIQDELVDACHRGAPRLRAWLSSECMVLTAAEWHLAHRTLCSAWIASGIHECGDRSSAAAESSPWAYSDLAESWARALLGTEPDREYSFAVKLDTGWRAKTTPAAQALLRSIVRSAAMSSSGLKLPDLLELGTGRTSVPPIAFYEAVLQLAGCVAERVRHDLAGGWLSVALGVLRGRDPVADICAGIYVRDPWTAGHPPGAELPPALATWRQSLSIYFLSSLVADVAGAAGVIGGVLEGQRDRQAALWLHAWEACSLSDHRTVLARDAASLGMLDRPEVGPRIEALLAGLDAGSCVEGALLAGSIARQSAPRPARTWLRCAIDCLCRADDDDWRAEAIAALEPLLGELAEAGDRQRVAALRAGLAPRHQAVASGCASRWFRSWAMAHWPAEEPVRGALAATLLVAAALEARARDAGGSRSAATAAALWKELATALATGAEPGQVRGAVHELVDLAGAGALVLTDPAIQALQDAARQPLVAEAAGVARLLPLLERPAGAAVPRLRQLQHQLGATRPPSSSAFGPDLESHIALWLAETERRFSGDDLAPLSRLVERGDDRARARVGFLVHGPQTWLGNRPAVFSLAALASEHGDRTMERLGERVVEEAALERHEAILGRSLYEWRLDDAGVLRRWLRRLSAAPDDAALLHTVFMPWRWSDDCLASWSEWIQDIRDPKCLKTCVEWLATLHVAAADGGDGEVRLPAMPRWHWPSLPDLAWLPRKTADRLVITALADAASTAQGTAAIVARARDLLAAEVRHLRELEGQDSDAAERILLSLGDALTQTLGDRPENAWLAIKELNKLRWSADEVAALMAWTHESLTAWHRNRQDAPLVLQTICTSQLSILACLADLWPNSVRHAAMQAPSWVALLSSVVRYFHGERAVQAAWVVLARVAGPGTQADDVWAALRCSMKDRPIVHNRVLSVLASDDGKSLMAALSPTSVRAALDEWADEPSGQSVLTMARMFGILVQEPALDGRLRQEIQTRLRALATRPSSHRFLFRLVGLGGKLDAAYKLASGGRLDTELQTLDSGLFTSMTSAI